jgi:anti-sigma B factor antagonist
MSCEVKEQDGTLQVDLGGSVDLEHADGVRAVLLDCIEKKRDIKVSLAAVDYIDSSGIATLVEAFQLAKENGTAFVLAAVSAQALRVLKLARLDTVFTILDPEAAT